MKNPTTALTTQRLRFFPAVAGRPVRWNPAISDSRGAAGANASTATRHGSRMRRSLPSRPSYVLGLRRHGQEHFLERPSRGHVFFQFLGTAGGNQLTMMNDAYAAAEPLRHVEYVSGQKNR